AMFTAFMIISFALGIANCQSLNVTDFGAVGDGKTDDSLAFLKAWKALCAATNTPNPTLEIPSNKTFLLKQVQFSGPCKSKSIHIHVLGNIVAPNNNTWTKCDNGCWLCFSNVAGLTTPKECGPAVISFHKCDNLKVHGITSLNSPGNHVSLNGSKDVNISHIQLIAPKDSPNTDGIDISASSTSNLNITSIACGPGHGISVGSLGKNGKFETVEEVHVRNSTFNGTQNGARIKTWTGGSGFARNISFDGIQLVNVQNPIIIDQHYCPHKTCPREGKSAVKISNVTFSGFQGTSATDVAIKLDCSSIVPCTDITLNNNTITSSTPGKNVTSECNNVRGSSTLTKPIVPCLPPKSRENYYGKWKGRRI
ncbi:Glycoside hydrolase, partial [Theobroma cacao]